MMAQTKVQREFVLTVTDEELLTLEQALATLHNPRHPGTFAELHAQISGLRDKAGLKPY